jgi:hypothetical protein
MQVVKERQDACFWTRWVLGGYCWKRNYLEGQ